MTALWRFCKIERKGHFIGSFCQVCGISENVLTEMHNSDKLLLLINKWIFGHFSYRFDGPSKPLLFYFSVIHVKWVAIICFNENWSPLKRPFWNSGTLNMLSHFFMVFTFSCLQKLSLLNINIWNSF